MPSYLKDKVKGREGEDTLQKHYTKYKERFNDKTPDILKGQYLMMYEHDDSCGQHVFQVNQVKKNEDTSGSVCVCVCMCVCVRV